MIGIRSLSSGFLVALAVMLAAGARPAHAEGPGTGGRRIRLADEPAGPYILRVVTSPNPPQIETLYVEVRVREAGSQTLIRDANVSVTAKPLNGDGPVLETTATHDIAPIPSDYAAHLPVPSAGDWTIEVTIESQSGSASVTFQEHVVSRNTLAPLLSAVLPFAGLALLIVIFLVLQKKDDDADASSPDLK